MATDDPKWITTFFLIYKVCIYTCVLSWFTMYVAYYYSEFSDASPNDPDMNHFYWLFISACTIMGAMVLPVVFFMPIILCAFCCTCIKSLFNWLTKTTMSRINVDSGFNSSSWSEDQSVELVYVEEDNLNNKN